ncbi:hypothetical protein EDB83DRAFT_1841824 [Lactarius deliciosus]|nr:hypothetical protein EDB83DRAFT_1841824 [Lactarius deliciosus]
MVQHVDSWFSFAKTLDLGIESIRMEDIVLVTGRHRTRSWTNIAFIESQGRVQRQVAFGVHVSGTPPSYISVDWKSPRELGQGVASNMGPSGEDLSDNQCVFIRGFRVTHTRQVLNWFRDTARSTSGLNENRDKSKPARQQTSQSTPTITYRDPLSSLLEYIASDPHSDMVLVHDDDLARFHEISDVSSLETLQRDVVLARLRDVQPKIQQVFSGSPSANNGRRVAMFSKEQAKIPLDESATPTSNIGRDLSRLMFFSKAPRKNLSSASNSSQPMLRHGTRRARHDASSSMDAPVRLSAYMADMDYAPTHSSLNIRLEAPNAGIAQNEAEKSTERRDQSRESQFTCWIPTLLEITQDFEQLAQGSLEKIARLGQDIEREPPNLVLRRSEVRLLMCCASLPPAEFASTKGHSQPSAAKPYYPTGDPEQDKNIAFTTAVECCEVLRDLHSGNDAASIATKYFELSQALSDLSLLHYASITSGFALETFQALHVTAPDNFGLSVASVLSLRANILADLEQDEEAVNAANGAVALCQH